MPAPIHAKVVIIGSGPAGYTAAIYAARAMLEPVMIQGIQPGGQLTITTDVENYPGFADVIQGPWLMEQMEKQAAHVGTKIVTDLVNKLELAQRPFRLTCDSGDVYLAETVISGVSLRVYLGQAFQGIAFADYILPTVKTTVFGFIIGTVSSYLGYTATGGSEGVGRASTRSVVLSSMLLIVVNVVLVRIIQMWLRGQSL